jgi:hypothetical protein
MSLKSIPIVLVLSLSLASAVFLTTIRCSGQLQWRISTRIEVFADGSATWVIERRTAILTEDDEAAFYQYLNISSPDQIFGYVHSMVDQASLITGRSMRVENLVEINASVSTKGLSKEGIIRFQFDWIGFAEQTGDGGINIGDALNGEMDFSLDDEITIVYPNGYSAVFVYPLPDNTQPSERTLIWFGPRNFGAGEPQAHLEKSNSSWTDAITSNIPLLAVIAAAVSTGFCGYFLGIKRASANKFTKPNGSSLQLHSPQSDEDDEEKVLRLLTAAGGRMYQSTITEQCGFSKSKASGLMSTMELKGVISRKKIGRGKIVTLVGKQETKKEE